MSSGPPAVWCVEQQCDFDCASVATTLFTGGGKVGLDGGEGWLRVKR